MHIRTAELTDLAAIKKLYQHVARAGNGIARLEHEVTDEYVHNFISRSLASGLIIVAEHPENKNEIVAEIHAYKPGIRVFEHVLSELTIDRFNPHFQAAFDAEAHGLIEGNGFGVAFAGDELYFANVGAMQTHFF